MLIVEVLIILTTRHFLSSVVKKGNWIVVKKGKVVILSN